ncbi:methyl-accepting chemotaxis protein [Comamonas aquatica]|uniref:methyl-accepting chemotaxis protein n=1 Tax=Comamonas aquatica TaxID=225991 RepID=UPI00244A68D6|nr:methyl-accepting chemotaxis protein [Comamonas aquatica]MDH0380296.1 methyl-accepting chemotaxis protein [Comamonas aquatica]MDH0428316.1 methyl-accepting chemotaxis protein [Comamonas aquatica]MDH0939681.1 methyl-accepting chemotaxis protein [Comamonas aquatica]
MQFKNLSVAKKIWLLMLLVMAAMLLAGVGMTASMKQLESHLREEVQTMEERIRLVVELRGSVETAAGYLIAGNLAQDSESMQFFEGKFGQAAAHMTELMQSTESRLRSAEGRALFQQIVDKRAKLNTVAEQVGLERRNDGDVVRLVRADLVPAVESFIADLNALVQLQEQMLARTLAQAERERTTSYALGLAALAVVVVLGLLLAVWLVRQLTAPLARAVALSHAIAAGNLTQDVHDDRKDELGELLRGLSAMTQKLRSVVGEVRNGVDSVSSAASQIATGNQDLSARTEQTAANLEETAASIEELTATVTQSADTARQANQLASTAVQAAERGGEVVNQVVRSMEQINTSSRKISDIIGVIDGIAFQTNILALNAAVEAARAGEQGRGFAVVAGEVRSLAQRSAEAAKEIKQLISASVDNVDTGSAQVAQAGESMQEIVASVRRVTDLIGEITASATEQRDGIGQVNQAVSNLDQMTQQNAALVEESSAAATSMNEQAQRLADVVAVFNVGQGAVAALARPTVAAPAARTPAAPAQRGAQGVANAQPAVTPPAVVAPAPAKKAPAAAKPAAAPQLLKPAPLSSKATAPNDDDWETF